jgi:hypothetical protein
MGVQTVVASTVEITARDLARPREIEDSEGSISKSESELEMDPRSFGVSLRPCRKRVPYSSANKFVTSRSGNGILQFGD